MNGVTQHAKPVTVGQPPMNTPVGKCLAKLACRNSGHFRVVLYLTE